MGSLPSGIVTRPHSIFATRCVLFFFFLATCALADAGAGETRAVKTAPVTVRDTAASRMARGFVSRIVVNVTPVIGDRSGVFQLPQGVERTPVQGRSSGVPDPPPRADSRSLTAARPCLDRC